MFWTTPSETRNFLALDPYFGSKNRPGVKAAYRSAAYILRAALCDELDVDPAELEVVNLAPVGSFPKRVGRIILGDRNPNGAGYAVALSEKLQEIFEIIKESPPESTNWKWLSGLTNESHRSSCSTSCNDCIRYYTNQGEHGLMDWRLGLDLLRILANPTELLFADSVGSFDEAVQDLENMIIGRT